MCSKVTLVLPCFQVSDLFVKKWQVRGGCLELLSHIFISPSHFVFSKSKQQLWDDDFFVKETFIFFSKKRTKSPCTTSQNQAPSHCRNKTQWVFNSNPLQRVHCFLKNIYYQHSFVALLFATLRCCFCFTCCHLDRGSPLEKLRRLKVRFKKYFSISKNTAGIMAHFYEQTWRQKKNF